MMGVNIVARLLGLDGSDKRKPKQIKFRIKEVYAGRRIRLYYVTNDYVCMFYFQSEHIPQTFQRPRNILIFIQK